MKGFLVAGTASGVGKTTVALAIAAAFTRRGLRVQMFKGGPDFLDTGHHTRISGRTARNIDTWMLHAEANREVVAQAARDADVVLVEGMMGLFDGKDGTTELGSSAEIAKLLRLPVVLVLDAGKSARSLAAVVLGFETFDPALQLAGVILNRIAGERHFRLLETAIAATCRTPVIGWLLREPQVAIPERHLGLRTTEEADEIAAADLSGALADLAEAHLDLTALLSLECGLIFSEHKPPMMEHEQKTVRIGVARDRAFSFYYEDNLDLLRQCGAEIVPFSPLQDQELPEELDALYLGGGYPELHAEQLSGNTDMLAAVRRFAASGRPIYAECGGMMYLARELRAAIGKIHALAGVFPFAIEMTDRLVKFGYVTVELSRDCLLGSKGTSMRGHSFHHSRIVNATATDTSYSVSYSLSGMKENEGFTLGNVLGSYMHVHFRAEPDAARSFVAAALAQRSAEVITR